MCIIIAFLCHVGPWLWVWTRFFSVIHSFILLRPGVYPVQDLGNMRFPGWYEIPRVMLSPVSYPGKLAVLQAKPAQTRRMSQEVAETAAVYSSHFWGMTVIIKQLFCPCFDASTTYAACFLWSWLLFKVELWTVQPRVALLLLKLRSRGEAGRFKLVFCFQAIKSFLNSAESWNVLVHSFALCRGSDTELLYSSPESFPSGLLRFWSPTRTSFETGKFFQLSDLPKMPRKEREILEDCNFPIFISIAVLPPVCCGSLWLFCICVSIVPQLCFDSTQDFLVVTGLSVSFSNPCFGSWSSLGTSTQ